MGLGNLNPGDDCCGPPLGDGCPNCFKNDSPAVFQVTFSGIVNDPCTGASTLNSSWNVPLFGPVANCHWVYFLSDAEAAALQLIIPPCGCETYISGGGGDDVSISVDVDDIGGGDYEIVVDIQFRWGGLHGCPDLTPPFFKRYVFRKTYTGEKPHCIELVDEDIPYDSGSTTAQGYSASGATCLLTAV